jgi:PTH1 family peptidyl-tRNA hydrolase
MQVVVGLGNPGSQYVHTRHNIGFRVVEALAVQLSLRFSLQKKVQGELAHGEFSTKGANSKNTELYLLKPQTFMNNSGLSVRSVYDYFGHGKPDTQLLSKLFVVHDDLDIQLGKYKIQLAKGPKVHNGLTSIYQHLGSTAFYHVRVGIENRGTDRAAFPGQHYVLAKFTTAEEDTLHHVTTQLVQEMLQLLQLR